MATSCGSDPSEKTLDSSKIINKFVKTHEANVSINSISDFPETDTIRSLTEVGPAAGEKRLIAEGAVGHIIAARVAEVRYGADDIDTYLLFTLEANDKSLTYLAVPHAPADEVDDLNALVGRVEPLAYSLGVAYSSEARMVWSDGSPVDGPIINQLPSFPLVAGIDGDGVATSLTSSQPIPATDDNLEPLVAAGFDVSSFEP
jgi:hypothetical protein